MLALPRNQLRRLGLWLPTTARRLWRETDGLLWNPCCCGTTGSTSTRGSTTSSRSRALMPPATSCASCCPVSYILICSGAADRAKPGVDNTSAAQINCTTGCPNTATCTSYNGVFGLTLSSCNGGTDSCGWNNIFGCVMCDQRSTSFGGSADYFGMWDFGISHQGDHLIFGARPIFFRKSLAAACNLSASLQSFGCEYLYETATGDLQCDLERTLDFALIAPSTCTIACTFPATIQIIPVV